MLIYSVQLLVVHLYGQSEAVICIATVTITSYHIRQLLHYSMSHSSSFAVDSNSRNLQSITSFLSLNYPANMVRYLSDHMIKASVSTPIEHLFLIVFNL